MFNFFKRRTSFDDEKKKRFVDAISQMLELQLAFTGNRGIEDPQGNINPKAIGYIYGFIDSALRTIGQDMSDTSIGVPITYQVLSRLFPGREEEYALYLIDNMGTNEMVTLGAMIGGQQYIDFGKFGKEKLGAPMGLARAILETEVTGDTSNKRNDHL